MARLAALGLKSGAGAVLGRDDDGQAAAQQAAEVLGTLRGLAAKVGQMASYVDGLVPEGKREAFEASLKVLRSQAPRSSAAAVRNAVETELGAPMDVLFASFDDEPIASASIGQVHRARLPEVMGGTEVAVKVQHPGIRKAVESDLANAGILEGLGGMMGGRRLNSKGHFEILKARFREELDYALEAERLDAFAALHEGDPTIRVPRLVKQRSSASILTTELVKGKTLEEVVSDSADERRAYGETLWRFVFKGNLVGGMFNADPHPGNYVFQGDGTIAFLDYGCVQVIPEPRRPLAQALHRAAVARDEGEFAKCVSVLLDAKPGTMEKLAREYSRLCFEPLFASPYRVTRSYAAGLVDSMKTMAMATRKLPDHEVFSMPTEMLFMNRLQFGFYSVLARLDVEVDYARVEEGFLG
ncbi:MAG: AarF/ABC1/UbiB kinase family protein [Deltaproteobacteria bacterium]|nr:AarF/ABC1/UbiB kinase family protein [Deltaproteobacteria bacterium]